MRRRRILLALAGLLLLLRLLLPSTARSCAEALRAALIGGDWERVETLGRSVTEERP
ncbi:MAG: hypothetical protein IJJ43_07680 [Oscillospiraceae bacterium]|nr:hypothetical protein [Oscillospiraceae bacterium]